MDRDLKQYQALQISKNVAELLNNSNDSEQMLENALKTLLVEMDLHAGWILLSEEEAVDCATMNDCYFSLNAKQQITMQICDCFHHQGTRKGCQSIFAVKCQHQRNAKVYIGGDIEKVYQYKSFPIMSQERNWGALYVGMLDNKPFKEHQHALLQWVADQIGNAVRRARIYKQEKEVTYFYAAMNEVTRSIWRGEISDLKKLLLNLVEQLGVNYGWRKVAIMIEENDHLTLKAMYQENHSTWLQKSVPVKELFSSSDVVSRAFRHKTIFQGIERSLLFDILNHNKDEFVSIAVPLIIYNKLKGVLWIGRERKTYNECDFKNLEALADHIALAIENVQLYEEREYYLLVEERNRLARDLHDSVNQKLFSLSLTARGLKDMLTDHSKTVVKGIENIELLAKEALSEMRSLIWELRPHGNQNGIGELLKGYAEKIGLQVNVHMDKNFHLPKKVKEIFWRIGQESLNNICKHAQTNSAEIRLEQSSKWVRMVVADQGCGFSMDQGELSPQSFGITSMKERVAQINGKLTIHSILGKGTTVMATAPSKRRKQGVGVNED